MRVTIDIIDADPAERERVDNGKVINFKRFKLKNNKSPVNRNVQLLAQGYSNALGQFIEGSYITIEHNCTERDGVLTYISELVLTSDVTGDSVDFTKKVFQKIYYHDCCLCHLHSCNHFPCIFY